MKHFRMAALIALAVTLVLAGAAVAAQMNFRAHLSGSFEVPMVVDTQAQGQTIFQLNDEGTAMTYKLNVANIENVRMAHIHLMPAMPGVNGPIIVWLYPETPPFVTIPGRFDGTLAEGVITEEDLAFSGMPGMTFEGLIEAMRSGNTYVNVHTDQYPAGEIHGPVH